MLFVVTPTLHICQQLYLLITLQVGLTETVDEATASKVLESIKCKSLNYRQFIVHHEKLLEKVPEGCLVYSSELIFADTPLTRL